MQNLTPLNPDIKPEEEPAAAPPVPPLQQPNDEPVESFYSTLPSGNPEPQPPVEPTPSAAMAPETPANAPATIYPSPLSSEERFQQHQAALNVPGSALGTPISQYFIPLITGVFALWGLWNVIQTIIKGFGLGLAGSGLFFSGGLVRYMWMLVIFSGIQLAFLIFISYKIFRGSKIALALLTGPAAIYLQYKFITYVSMLSFVGFYFKSFTTVCWLIGEIALAVLLVWAWTKDRKHYA